MTVDSSAASVATAPESLNTNCPLYRRGVDASRGRHLISTSRIDVGTLIFRERPLLSLQSVGNAQRGALVCRSCRCFIGGPGLALAISSGRVSREDALVYWDQEEERRRGEAQPRRHGDAEGGAVNKCVESGEDVDLDYDNTGRQNHAMVPCRNRCGELFCSEQCESDLWLHGHDLLCTGLIPDPAQEERVEDEGSVSGDSGETSKQDLHPLLKFKMHAVESNEIFLMVADLVAMVVSKRARQMQTKAEERSRRFNSDDGLNVNDCKINANVSSLEDLLSPYLDFTLMPWWEVATNPLISPPSELDESIDLARTLRTLCADSAQLLRVALLSCPSYPTDNSEDKNRRNFIKKAMEEFNDSHGVFSSEMFFGKIIGSFEQNAIGIRARHPLCRDVFRRSLRVNPLCHRDLVHCIERAGMIGDSDNEDENEVYEGKNTAVEKDNASDGFVHPDGDIYDDEEENNYNVDEIAGFVAGLHIDERNGVLPEKEDSAEDFTDMEVVTNEECEDTDGDDLDILFVPLDGTGMYLTTCKMNHSCEPNVIVRYHYSYSSGTQGNWGCHHPLILECVAIKDIDEGEELCISYITNDNTVGKREEELANYGFQCRCPKCETQRTKKEEGNNVPVERVDLETQSDLVLDCDDGDVMDSAVYHIDNNINVNNQHLSGITTDAEGRLEDTKQQTDPGEISLMRRLVELDRQLATSNRGCLSYG